MSKVRIPLHATWCRFKNVICLYQILEHYLTTSMIREVCSFDSTVSDLPKRPAVESQQTTLASTNSMPVQNNYYSTPSHTKSSRKQTRNLQAIRVCNTNNTTANPRTRPTRRLCSRPKIRTRMNNNPTSNNPRNTNSPIHPKIPSIPINPRADTTKVSPMPLSIVRQAMRNRISFRIGEMSTGGTAVRSGRVAVRVDMYAVQAGP